MLDSFGLLLAFFVLAVGWLVVAVGLFFVMMLE